MQLLPAWHRLCRHAAAPASRERIGVLTRVWRGTSVQQAYRMPGVAAVACRTQAKRTRWFAQERCAPEVCAWQAKAVGAAALPRRCMTSSVPFVDSARLVVKFSRSSGPGGQHVNKTESKVDMRVHMDHIKLPPEAMRRLQEAESGRINKAGELVVTSDEHRERQRNYEACMAKLAQILTRASVEPKVRNMKSKTAGVFNARRLQEKKMQSKRKEGRRRVLD